MTQPLSYGLIGLGPIGYSLAACLIEAGQKVSAYCIEPNKTAALRKAPIKIQGKLNVTAQIPEIYDSLSAFLTPRYDVVLIAIKSCDTPALLDEIRSTQPEIKSVFVSCQNGLDVERYYVERFGWDRTLRMVLHLGASLINDNTAQVSFSHTHWLSDSPQGPGEIARHLANDLSRGGFQTELTQKYRTEVFKKAILNSSLGAVCAVTGNTMKRTIEDALLRPLVERMIDEAILVAQAEGLEMPSDFKTYALQYMALGGEHKPSILVDLEKGRRTENEDHCGRIHHFAVKHHIPDPVLESFYVLVKRLEERGERQCR